MLNFVRKISQKSGIAELVFLGANGCMLGIAVFKIHWTRLNGTDLAFIEGLAFIGGLIILAAIAIPFLAENKAIMQKANRTPIQDKSKQA